MYTHKHIYVITDYVITYEQPLTSIVLGILSSVVSLDQEVFSRFCKAGTSKSLPKPQIRNK